MITQTAMQFPWTIFFCCFVSQAARVTAGVVYRYRKPISIVELFVSRISIYVVYTWFIAVMYLAELDILRSHLDPSLRIKCRPEATKNWAGPASFPFKPASFPSFSCLKIFKDEFWAGKFWSLHAKTGTPFFGAQERDIIREITVTPWTQFVGAIPFVLGSQETIFRKTNCSLPVNEGWNTCCAVVSHARRSIDTFIVSQSRVQLMQCQCKSQLQITNLGINNVFLFKSSLFDHAVCIRHLVQTRLFINVARFQYLSRKLCVWNFDLRSWNL